MTEQLTRIKAKLSELEQLDRGFTLFGSSRHKYRLNARLSPEKINQFEQTHGVRLPDGYVQFLTRLGNGGAGPFYGLEPFKNVLFDDLDYRRADSLLDPSKPFPHTEAWNLKFVPTVDEDKIEDEYDAQQMEFEETYFDNEHMNGVLAICNFGCAVSLNLVVNGPEYGNIWTDDRSSDYGIHPSHELGNEGRITFLDWYELWLDNSLNELKSKLPVLAPENKRPWWKLW